MGRGAGIVADAKQSRSTGDQLSTGNQLDRTGFSGSGGSKDSDGEDAWIAEADGSCTLRNYPVGKTPPNSFKTREACREAQDNSYNCVGGKCEKAPAGTAGRYKSLGECEAALVSPGFTGGQCVVNYRIRLTWPTVFNGIGNTSDHGPYLGPIIAIRQQFIEIPYTNAEKWRAIVTHKNITGETIETAITDQIMAPGGGFSSWSIIDDGQANNCGDPAKICPTA
jgi:hypothetical protein